MKRFFLLGLMYVSCLPASGQPRQGYSFQQYTVNRGLTSNAVRSMAEDANGFIWLATNTSVQWFDGFSFHQVPAGNGIHQLPARTNVIINRLQNGMLLFCYTAGFSVYEPKSHQFRHYSFPSDKKLQPLFLADNGSRAWMLYQQSVIQYDISSFEIVRNIPVPVMPAERATVNVSASSRGRYIVFSYDGSYNVVLDTVSVQLSTHMRKYSRKPRIGSALHMATDTSYLEISADGTRYRHISTGEILQEVKMTEPLAADPQSQIWYSSLGDTLIIAGGRSVFTYSVSRGAYLSQIVAIANRPFIQAGQLEGLITDRYHNIWLSSNVEGLFRINYSSNRFRYYGGGERSNFSISVEAGKADNRVVSGTYGQGIFVYDTMGLLLKHIPFADTQYRHLVTIPAVRRVAPHRYLFCLYGGEDFYILNTQDYSIQRTWIRWPGKPSRFSFNYYGKIYAVDEKTFAYNSAEEQAVLFSVEGNMLQCRQIIPEPLILHYASGNVLAGSNKDRQIIIQQGNKRELYIPFRQAAAINSITRTGKGVYWAATSSGLYRLGAEGRITKQYTTTEGLANDYIFSVVADNEDNIWCSHFKGISKITPDGIITNISAAEGLQGDEFNTGSVCKTEDGELYFGGVNGINSFYPDQVARTGEFPDVIVTRISAGDHFPGADTAFWNISSISLRHSQNAVQLSFSALGKQTAEVYNYQYRLRTGAGGEWSDLRHTNSLNFSLDPGTYYLDLYAGSFFDPQARPLKTIKVVIAPAFYRNWWFLAGCAVLLLLAFWQLSRWLSRKKYRKELERALQVQKQLEEERERISRDLHDNMGAYTSALLANVQQAKDKAGDDAEDDVLKKMETNAEHILSSLRETIWVLHHPSVTVRDFSDGFKNYCFKILRNFEDIRFNAEEQIGVNKEIPASKAVHLNKILQEAVQNVIKHAGATEIAFAIRCDGIITLSLSDNGKGFDFTALEKGNGLDNMQWRAAEAGFRLFIEPVRGRGTQIRLVEGGT